MSTLYALMRARSEKQTFGRIEVIDLDALSLHTVVELEFRPWSFAVSAAQQALYVVDRDHAQLVVHDTTGKYKGWIPLASPPYDCVLTNDSSRLLVSTDDGLVSIDTATLKIEKAVNGPAVKVGTSDVDAPWLPPTLALSPDSTRLAVCDSRPLVYAKASPHLWVVDTASLTPLAGFDLAPPQKWVAPGSSAFLCDVVYAGESGWLTVASVNNSLAVVNVVSKTVSPWFELKKSYTESGDIRRWSECLHYGSKPNLVFITTGLGPRIGKSGSAGNKWQPGDPAPSWVLDGSALWSESPDATSRDWRDGFKGAVGVACLDPQQSSVLVSVTNTWYVYESGQLQPDSLARYTIASQTLEPVVYTFSGSYDHDLAVISMQAVGGSPLDPPQHFPDFYAEQSVAILIGLIGGGSGWVISPHGIISPVDPEPLRPTARELPQAVRRALRAAMLIDGAAGIRDPAIRDQVRHRALQDARRHLAGVKLHG